MKAIALIAVVATLCASLVAADIVITPVFQEQIVEKLPGDCPYGEVTPQGCG
jgi:hypothetical protein